MKGKQFPVHFFRQLFVGKVSHYFIFIYRINSTEAKALELYDFVKFGCNPRLTDSIDIAFRATYFHIYSINWSPVDNFCFCFLKGFKRNIGELCLKWGKGR